MRNARRVTSAKRRSEDLQGFELAAGDRRPLRARAVGESNPGRQPIETDRWAKLHRRCRRRCWVLPSSRAQDSNPLLPFTRRLLFPMSYRGRVPREGVEPPRLAAPVSETGASSDSATGAGSPPEKGSHLRLPGFNRALVCVSYLARPWSRVRGSNPHRRIMRPAGHHALPPASRLGPRIRTPIRTFRACCASGCTSPRFQLSGWESNPHSRGVTVRLATHCAT